MYTTCIDIAVVGSLTPTPTKGRTASRRAGKVEYSPGGYGTQSGTTGGGVTVAYWCF